MAGWDIGHGSECTLHAATTQERKCSPLPIDLIEKFKLSRSDFEPVNGHLLQFWLNAASSQVYG